MPKQAEAKRDGETNPQKHIIYNTQDFDVHTRVSQ